MEKVKVWYDPEGDYLEVMFEKKEGYFKETESDQIMEKVDMEGNVIGFSILKVSSLKDHPLEVSLFIFNERLGVLEILLRILPPSPWGEKLIVDIRRFFAESKIMLDLRGSPPLIVPLEEPMMQREIIENLLPRLSERFPERAKELIRCYHSVRAGENLDSIFSEAFKSLEEIARSITGNNKFVFDKANLKKYFPLLHLTIHETMIKLAGHRGDEAGHGKASPDMHEIRYLLFSICNIALLLLDYPKDDTKGFDAEHYGQVV
jgi:uncharacterized protein YuzE